MLTPYQVHALLGLIDRQLLIFVGKTIGEEGLSDQDKSLLMGHGIDYTNIYDPNKDLVKQNFQLGMLSNILSNEEIKNLTYEELTKYIKSGNYIPLNQREISTINNIKMQSLADIKSTRNRIFQDINNVVAREHSTDRANQEEYIREKIVEGNENRLSRKQIARDIARATGDWNRNFDKSVAYISHTALNEGRAAMIERRYGNNEDAKIYFLVQQDACPICIKSYLTNGAGSEPKIFTLKELQGNGSNIGRKQAEWLPTLQALHVHCRCLATEYIQGMVWDGVKFVWPKGKEAITKLNRPKIRITVDGKEHFV